ncbi:MAG: hypothetical protein IJ578_02325 [Bacteroidales bacterium]|nr:hypothetical protein [Bacteroidales bacterium]
MSVLPEIDAPEADLNREKQASFWIIQRADYKFIKLELWETDGKTDKFSDLARMIQATNHRIWHLFSDGTRADIPFGRDEDKTYVWNSIAICSFSSEVRILVATVNDTHFHLLVRGEGKDAEKFRGALLHRLRFEFRGDRIEIAMDPVNDRREILSKFMHVYPNCLDFYRKLPWEYPWGSGNIYFSEKCHFYRGALIGKEYGRAYRRFFKTRIQLPQEWRYNERGMILPECFIDYEYVESLFGTIRTWLAFLYVRKEDEARIRQQVEHRYLEHRSILDLRRQGNLYCQNLCKRSLAKAPIEMRLRTAVRMIQDGLSGKNASLAKALYLEPEDLQRLL